MGLTRTDRNTIHCLSCHTLLLVLLVVLSSYGRSGIMPSWIRCICGSGGDVLAVVRVTLCCYGPAVSFRGAKGDDGHTIWGKGVDGVDVGLGSWDVGNDGVVMSPWWVGAEMVFPRWHGGYLLV